MPRHELDFYETPPHYIAALIGEVNVYGHVFEPCVGDGAIADALKTIGAVRAVATNDIDPARKARTHLDAKRASTWDPNTKKNPLDWAITNPPFADALPILEHALYYAQNVAFLARLSFLEPTAEREQLLEMTPPRRLIILPRYSFRLNDEGKRQTDSVTCCWMVWGANITPGVSVWGKGKSQAYAVMSDLT